VVHGETPAPVLANQQIDSKTLETYTLTTNEMIRREITDADTIDGITIFECEHQNGMDVIRFPEKMDDTAIIEEHGVIDKTTVYDIMAIMDETGDTVFILKEKGTEEYTELCIRVDKTSATERIITRHKTTSNWWEQ
jgi:hypothetical protein